MDISQFCQKHIFRHTASRIEKIKSWMNVACCNAECLAATMSNAKCLWILLSLSRYVLDRLDWITRIKLRSLLASSKPRTDNSNQENNCLFCMRMQASQHNAPYVPVIAEPEAIKWLDTTHLPHALFRKPQLAIYCKIYSYKIHRYFHQINIVLFVVYG